MYLGAVITRQQMLYGNQKETFISKRAIEKMVVINKNISGYRPIRKRKQFVKTFTSVLQHKCKIWTLLTNNKTN